VRRYLFGECYVDLARQPTGFVKLLQSKHVLRGARRVGLEGSFEHSLKPGKLEPTFNKKFQCRLKFRHSRTSFAPFS
jgi:hypothetical protein